MSWPDVHVERSGAITEEVDYAAIVNDFADCLEQWADWCDSDSERLDALDNLSPVIDSHGLVEAVSRSQPAVAI